MVVVYGARARVDPVHRALTGDREFEVRFLAGFVEEMVNEQVEQVAVLPEMGEDVRILVDELGTTSYAKVPFLPCPGLQVSLSRRQSLWIRLVFSAAPSQRGWARRYQRACATLTPDAYTSGTTECGGRTTGRSEARARSSERPSRLPRHRRPASAPDAHLVGGEGDECRGQHRQGEVQHDQRESS